MKIALQIVATGIGLGIGFVLGGLLSAAILIGLGVR